MPCSEQHGAEAGHNEVGEQTVRFEARFWVAVELRRALEMEELLTTSELLLECLRVKLLVKMPRPHAGGKPVD